MLKIFYLIIALFIQAHQTIVQHLICAYLRSYHLGSIAEGYGRIDLAYNFNICILGHAVVIVATLASSPLLGILGKKVPSGIIRMTVQ